MLIKSHLTKMASTTDDANTEGIDILFPDMLSKEELINILKMRRINKLDFNNLNKNQLIELFKKYVIPLPQREYRNNRRGKKMTISREKQEARKRKLDEESESVTAKRSKNDINNKNIAERLKSTLTLNSSCNPRKSTCSALNEDKRTRHSDKSDHHHYLPSNKLQSESYTSRKIKLKRNSDSTSSEGYTSQSSTSEKQEQKRKHEPITWP